MGGWLEGYSQRIAHLLVTEVLRNGEAGKGDASTGTRGLVHLSVDQSGLGASSGAGLCASEGRRRSVVSFVCGLVLGVVVVVVVVVVGMAQ